MNRRQSLKAIGLTTISAGLLLNSCKTGDKQAKGAPSDELSEDEQVGLEEFEKDRLKRIKKEGPFFNKHERATIIVLGDLIIPADEQSGSASDANVIDFIDFIVKDMPVHQVPLRGGLKWLDTQCLNTYGNAFIKCNAAQQNEILEEIAYPKKAKPHMRQGAAFFSRLRELVATGFYTSEIGVKDLGYVGNTPNTWPGVPKDVLAQYGLTEADAQRGGN